MAVVERLRQPQNPLLSAVEGSNSKLHFSPKMIDFTANGRLIYTELIYYRYDLKGQEDV
jgi:hypothetical protein